MLNATVISLKHKGKENVKHEPPIENQDLVRLKSSQVLALTNPLALLYNVWFHVVLLFWRQGRDGQRTLKTWSRPKWPELHNKAHDEVTKNHPGGIADVSSMEKYSQIYETDGVNDGYKALKLYTSKLNPMCQSFFQYPKKNWSFKDRVWYEPHPVRVNSLDSMMKNTGNYKHSSTPFPLASGQQP